MAKPTDRVQIQKRESGAEGGDAADDSYFLYEPLDSSEDCVELRGLFLQPETGSKDENVAVWRTGDDLIFCDITTGVESTLSDLLATASGSGVTANQHKALRDIIHFVDDGPGDGFASGAYREIVGQPFPTSITWYESNTKAEKIYETTITRPSVAKPTPIVHKMYGTDGTTVVVTIQDDITYDGLFEINRTRTIS
jgi:hypothetical protein